MKDDLIIGYDPANSREMSCVTLARKSGKTITLFRHLFGPQADRFMYGIPPKLRHIKRDRKHIKGHEMPQESWGTRRSNNWRRMHGYAMKKRAPSIMIIDEWHNHKG